jgi:hypothetical protein
VALHPASVEAGERVLLVFGGHDWNSWRVLKGIVEGHTSDGSPIVVVGGTDWWVLSYAAQGTVWAKGWDNPDALLAAYRLDASARSLA